MYQSIRLLSALFALLFFSLQIVHAQTCQKDYPQTTPVGRFEVHNDGTVTDKQTGLIWRLCLQGLSGIGCNQGTVFEANWEQALKQADSLYAGYDDWRVPNIKELQSIVEAQCYAPALNSVIFPSNFDSAVWSSSPVTFSRELAWSVSFYKGSANERSRNENKQVRLVRNGLNDGLVAYYPFDGDATNSAGSANDGQPTSSVTFGDGLFGQSAIFGGVDNPGHIYVPNSVALQFTEGATYSAWFRVDDLVYMDGYHNRKTTYGGGTIFAKSHDRRGAGFKVYISDQGTVSASVSTFDSWFSSGSYAEANWVGGKAIGEWTHLTYTLSATEGSRIYIDGQLSYGSTGAVAFANMNKESLYFGKYSDSWYPFIGAIDEVRIYSRVLNESEVQALYHLAD